MCHPTATLGGGASRARGPATDPPQADRPRLRRGPPHRGARRLWGFQAELARSSRPVAVSAGPSRPTRAAFSRLRAPQPREPPLPHGVHQVPTSTAVRRPVRDSRRRPGLRERPEPSSVQGVGQRHWAPRPSPGVRPRRDPGARSQPGAPAARAAVMGRPITSRSAPEANASFVVPTRAGPGSRHHTAARPA